MSHHSPPLITLALAAALMLASTSRAGVITDDFSDGVWTGGDFTFTSPVLTDTTYGYGGVGLINFFTSTPGDLVIFDNFFMTVPEPASAVVLALSAAVVSRRRRVRR